MPLAARNHVYREAGNDKAWNVVALWKHPDHRDYHVNWHGRYVVCQEYGVFSNPPRIVYEDDFERDFTLAWEPMRVCQFCGFTRMHPCEKRQTCPSLTDYRLEPDDVHDEDAA